MSAISGFCEKCNKFRKRHCDGNRNTCMSILFDTIEALQAENEQLKADCDRMLCEVQELTMEYNRFKERLQISPYGDDKIDELDEALANCKFQYEQLKQENEQLQAQVARVREALRKARETISAWDSWFECDRCKNMRDVLATIDKVIGGGAFEM